MKEKEFEKKIEEISKEMKFKPICQQIECLGLKNRIAFNKLLKEEFGRFFGIPNLADNSHYVK